MKGLVRIRFNTVAYLDDLVIEQLLNGNSVVIVNFDRFCKLKKKKRGGS